MPKTVTLLTAASRNLDMKRSVNESERVRKPTHDQVEVNGPATGSKGSVLEIIAQAD